MRRCPPPIANLALHTDRSVPGIHFICKQKILMRMHQDFLSASKNAERLNDALRFILSDDRVKTETQGALTNTLRFAGPSD